ncbi:MAG: sensor histidine kinase [Deltaproteobacteria bacterium]|nr:sensor histidine kinase [Nannocystaceae bacterium]
MGALGLHIELDAGSTSALVRGDHERLVRAIANLIDNALDASDDGGVVRVTTRHDQGGAHVEITDRGSGDAAVLRERASFSFSTDKPSGCGLGLLLVRDTAEAYGGRLEFVQVQPRGVTARISIPAQEVGT